MERRGQEGNRISELDRASETKPRASQQRLAARGTLPSLSLSVIRALHWTEEESEAQRDWGAPPDLPKAPELAGLPVAEPTSSLQCLEGGSGTWSGPLREGTGLSWRGGGGHLHWGPPWGTAELGVRLTSGPRALPRGPSALRPNSTAMAPQRKWQEQGRRKGGGSGAKGLQGMSGHVQVVFLTTWLLAQVHGLGTGRPLGPSLWGPMHCRM